MSTLRVALVQLRSTSDPASNLQQVRHLCAEAAEQGADVVVFPEATICSYGRPRIEVAEPLEGPWASGVRDVAREFGLTVVVGTFTPTGSGKVRNTLLVTGGVEASYDKLHLFDALGYAESAEIEAGVAPVTFQLGEVTIGLATCYDLRFPWLFQHYARLGAQLIVVPASWAPGPNKLHQWRTLVTARAMDSTSFVVGCDQAEPAADQGKRTPTGVGHSLAVDPFGTVLFELGPGAELRVIELDLTQVAGAQAALPVLAVGPA
ncbi:MAG: carbon-nitrogen hydrolase family protein [Micropruina sp.]